MEQYLRTRIAHESQTVLALERALAGTDFLQHYALQLDRLGHRLAVLDELERQQQAANVELQARLRTQEQRLFILGYVLEHSNQLRTQKAVLKEVQALAGWLEPVDGSLGVTLAEHKSRILHCHQ